MDTEDSGPAPARRAPWRLVWSRATREGTLRLEAFSDAIFAIAATLLVLEIKLPSHSPSPAHLLAELGSQWPVYVSYAMSFLYLGIYWAHHVHMFGLFRRTNHVFLKLNLVFLMLAALLPFPTALLGSYWGSGDERQRIALLIYTGTLLTTATAFLGVWRYAVWDRHLVDPDLPASFIRSTTHHYTVGPVAYAVAFLTAFVSAEITLGIVFVVALFYLLPIRLVVDDATIGP